MIATACLLGACARYEPSIEPPKPAILGEIDKRLEAPCPDVANVPDRPLTGEEIETLWKQDRGAALRCRWRHDAYSSAVRDRDRRFRGEIVR